MTKRKMTLLVAAVAAIAFVAGVIAASKMISVQAETKPGYGFAALAGQRVGQDVVNLADQSQVQGKTPVQPREPVLHGRDVVRHLAYVIHRHARHVEPLDGPDVHLPVVAL